MLQQLISYLYLKDRSLHKKINEKNFKRIEIENYVIKYVQCIITKIISEQVTNGLLVNAIINLRRLVNAIIDLSRT